MGGDPFGDLAHLQVLEAGVVEACETAIERKQIQIDEIVDMDVGPGLFAAENRDRPFRERLHRQQVDGEIQAHTRRITADRCRPNDCGRHQAGIAHHDALGDHLGFVVLRQREQLEVFCHARLRLETVHAG